MPVTPSPLTAFISDMRRRSGNIQGTIHGLRGREKDKQDQRRWQPQTPKYKNEHPQGGPGSPKNAILCSSQLHWAGEVHKALGRLAVPEDGHMSGPKSPGERRGYPMPWALRTVACSRSPLDSVASGAELAI